MNIERMKEVIEDLVDCFDDENNLFEIYEFILTLKDIVSKKEVKNDTETE